MDTPASATVDTGETVTIETADNAAPAATSNSMDTIAGVDLSLPPDNAKNENTNSNAGESSAAPEPEPDPASDLPIHFAAQNFDLKAVQEFCKIKDLHKRLDNQGRNALHAMVAAFIGLNQNIKKENYSKFRDILVALKQGGVDLNQGDKKGLTCLHMLAPNYNCVDVIKDVIEAGVRVNSTDRSGQTPIHKAVLVGNVENMRVLIHRGADPNVRDSEGQTPLHLAVSVKMNHEAVEYLLNHGASPNVEDRGKRSPLHAIVKVRRWEYVKVLMKNGARVDRKDSSGQTPVHMAAAKDMTGAVLKALVHGKPNLNIPDDIYHETALHKAIKHNMQINVRILTKRRANTNVKDMFGETALHKAAANTDIVLWQQLLQNKGDVNIPNEAGLTPYQKAVKARNTVAVALMRQYNKVE